MSILTELQQQIDQAEAKVKELREKLTEQKNNERAKTIIATKELIKRYQLTAAELGLSGRNATSGKGPLAAADKRTTVAPKYQDPISGKTWTGRGKTPAWLAAYLTAGQAKQDYLIK
jgi:DNA-binding protein H-NS